MPGREFTASPSRALFCTTCGASLAEQARFCGDCGAPVVEVPVAAPTTDQPVDPSTLVPAEPPQDSDPEPEGVWGLERFRVAGVLGRGETATAYLAFDAVLQSDVTLKLLDARLAADPAALARLWSEAETLSRIDDPHVARVIDHGHQGELAYLVLEYVEGASLRQLLDHAGPLIPEQVLGVIEGALSGLGRVHGEGIVHGDITPGNILVDREGRSVLTDFGLSGPTGARGLGVTPAYASPEAARGEQLDARSDLYSLAAVLYESLAGGPPFSGESDEAVLYQQVAAEVPPVPGLAAPLSDLLVWALSKDPAERPQSAEALRRALTETAGQVGGAQWRERASLAALASVAGGELGLAMTPVGTAGAPPPPAPGAPSGASALHGSPGPSPASPSPTGQSKGPQQPSSSSGHGIPPAPPHPRPSIGGRLLGPIASHKVVAAVTAAIVLAAGTGAAVAVATSHPAQPAATPPSPSPAATGPSAPSGSPSPGGSPAGPSPKAAPDTWIVHQTPPYSDPTMPPYFSSFSCPSATHCVMGGVGTGENIFIGSPATASGQFHPGPYTVTHYGSAGTFNALECPDLSHCYIAWSGGVLASTDGGSSWIATSAPAGVTVLSCPAVESCVGATATQPASLGGPAALVSTTNGGTTWQKVQLPVTELMKLDCPSIASCWGLANPQGNGTASLVVTRDGGKTWRQKGLVDGAQPLDIDCTSATNCNVLTNRKEPGGLSALAIETTSNAGRTWQMTNLTSTSGSFYEGGIDCRSKRRCVVVTTLDSAAERNTPSQSFSTSNDWRSFERIAVGNPGWLLGGPIDCPKANTCIALAKGHGTGPNSLAYLSPGS